MTAHAQSRSLSSARRGSQRERMLDGMIAAANREGYAGANVAAVIEEAGVSRPTFYQHFSDREQCFLAAIDEVHSALMNELRAALESNPLERADAAALQTLIAFAGSEPAKARFLMSESLAGGEATLDARDQSVQEFAELLDQTLEELPAGARTLDIPSEFMIGASYRILGSRLRRGERALSGLSRKMMRFMGNYEQPATERRWRRAPARAAVAAPPQRRASALRAPAPLPPGRPRIGEDAVAENHRLRIMFATAELVQEQGYTATTIAEITKRAGVDGRVFYRMFADKQEAFSAIHELGFQQLMAATAGAFFSAEHWPERMWKALSTLTDWLEGNPAIAHVGFVESYAVGPGAVQRVEDSLIAFTIFLQEGYQHQPIEHPPSHEALEAIVTCVFEIIYRELRHSEQPKISATLPALIYVSLTPFLGVSETNRFIDEQLASAS
jgi:AcrR family transcriptional regulator